MANTKIPSTGIDPRIHNHVVNYYGKLNSNHLAFLSSHKLPRRLRSAIRNQVHQNKASVRQFRAEGFKSI